MKGVGLEKFAGSTIGMVSFGALSGGLGAELSGGNFWQGAVTGGIVAGLNHAMHKEVNKWGEDPPKKKTKNNIDETLKKVKVGTNVASSAEIIDAIDEALAPKSRRILGKYGGKVAGALATGGELIYNGLELYDGKISGYRFTYRLGKTATTIIAGSQIAGPKGVAVGVFLGVGFDVVETAWDIFIRDFTQKMNEFQNNLNIHLINNSIR